MPLSFWNRWGNNDIEPKIRFNMGFFLDSLSSCKGSIYFSTTSWCYKLAPNITTKSRNQTFDASQQLA